MKGNMKRKILIGVLTIIFSLIIFSLTMQANASEEVTQVGSWDVSADDGESNVTATLYSDGSFIISGTGAMKNYTYDGHTPYYDNTSNIKIVKIESGVTSIGDYAFYECSSLTSIEIPEGVTSIGDYAFSDCSSLKSIEIPDGVTSIGNDAFYYCTSLESIEIPEGVTSIESWAFEYCTSLESIEIPSSVTSIGYEAFNGCSSLESIEIPEGVRSIGDRAFYGCSSLTNINVEGNNKKYSSENGVLFNKEKTNIIRYPAGKKETEYQIPKGVTSIGSVAFEYCNSLTSIEIPSSVTNIGENAFEYCTSLESIEIPEGVTSIESYAFRYCTNLENIKIPNSVTKIENWAFFDCYSLENIEIPKGVTSIGSYAFNTCSSLTSIEIPSSVTYIGDYAFSGIQLCIIIDQNKDRIAIPELIKRVQDENDILYSENIVLTNCNFDDNVENLLIDIDKIKANECAEIQIKSGALNGLTIYITNGIWDISANSDGSVIAKYSTDRVLTISGQGAMKNYSNNSSGEGWPPYCYIIGNKVKVVKIEEGVTSIGNYALYGCSSLTSIEIPEGVTSIGFGAFYGAKKMIIYCKNNSYAKEYAESKSINYIIKQIIKLSIEQAPNKTEYVQGDKFDATGMKVVVTYNNGDTKEISESEYIVKSGDSLSSGQTSVTISYTEDGITQTIAQEIDVDKKKITKLSIEQAPNKTEYVQGDKFDATGMKVVVTYNNGDTKEISESEYIVKSGDSLSSGQTSVTISYTEDGITKTTAQAITVEEKLKVNLKNYEATEENGIKYIENINPNTKIQELINVIETNGTIKIFKGNTEITDVNSKMQTGMIVKITLRNEEMSCILVVTGDLSGDGQIGNVDLLKIARYNAGLDTSLEGAYLKATDVYRDGAYGDNKDLLKTARVLAGLESL